MAALAGGAACLVAGAPVSAEFKQGRVKCIVLSFENGRKIRMRPLITPDDLECLRASADMPCVYIDGRWWVPVLAERVQMCEDAWGLFSSLEPLSQHVSVHLLPLYGLRLRPGKNDVEALEGWP